MMKQVKLIQHPADELDVMAVLKNALSFFSQYGKLLLIVALAGMLAGGIRFYTTPNLYSSSLVLKPTLLSDPEQLELINSWSALLKKKELPVLEREFQVEESLLKKVISIKTEELQKSFAPNNFTAFTLTVLVTDTAVLAPLQKGLLYALDNSEYIKEKLEARKNILRTMIQTVQQEITRLTSMQAAVEASLQQNNTSGSRFMVSVSDISNQLATLQEKKLNYEENLTFASAVYVLQNFYVPSKPAHPQLIKLLVIGFGGGLFLGCAIACFLYIKRKLAQT
jgi:prefoldin subunit 5